MDVNAALPIPHNDYGHYLIDGDHLFDFAAGRPQFNWSVLSALPSDYEIELAAIPRDSVLYANGNPDFWHGSPRPQFADALFEIVCWDSCATLLIGTENPNVLNAFRAAYPGTLNLDAENRSRS